MSKNNLILIIVAIILIITGLIYLNKSKDTADKTGGQQAVEVNQSPVAEKKENGTYEMYNTDIKTDSGSTKITATIKNVSANTTPEQFIELVLLDKQNKELGTIKTIVPSLGSGVATNISAESLKLYENIYDFKIK